MAERESSDNFSDGSDEFSIIDEQTIQDELNSFEDEEASSMNNTSNNSKFIFEDALMSSQYAKVVFYDVVSPYLTDADIFCRYSLTSAVTPAPGDRISLFKVGWSHVNEELTSELAPMPTGAESTYLHVVFKANTLPKDTSKYYQFCYINRDYNICGTSVSFQFRTPTDTELCEIELPEGITEIRSHGSFLENKLATLLQEKEKNEQAQEQLQTNLKKLQSDFDIVNSKWQSEISKVSKKLTENTDLNNQLIEKNKEIAAKDEKIDELLLKISNMQAEENSRRSTESIEIILGGREKLLKEELEQLEQMNIIMAEDKKLTMTELQNVSVKLQKAVTDNTSMESHISSLESQKEELVDCNMLLKREVESMRMKCEELRKMINPDLPSTSIFEAWLDPNKAKVQEFNKIIVTQKKELKSKIEQLESSEKQIEILQASNQELTSKRDHEMATNLQKSEEIEQLTRKVKDVEKLQTIVGMLKETNDNLIEERDTLSADLSHSKKINEELSVDLSHSNKINDVSCAKLSHFQRLNAELTKETETLKQKLAENVVEIDDLNKLNCELTKEQANLKKIIKEHKDSQSDGPTLNQIFYRINADITEMTLKHSNTHDLITKIHETRVLASKSRREIVDKLNKVSEDRTKLEATYDTRTQVSNCINQKLKDIQDTVLHVNMTREQQEEQDEILLKNMNELNQTEEIIEKISTEMIKNLELEDNLKGELMVWDAKIKQLEEEISMAKESAQDITKSIEATTAQLKTMQNLSEFATACDSLNESTNSDERVAILSARLKQSSDEYQSLLLEKQRLAKRMEKLKLKKSSGSSARTTSVASTDEQSQTSISPFNSIGATEEQQRRITNLMDSPVPLPERSETTSESQDAACPICFKIFPMNDLFHNHFPSHLS